MLFYAHVASGQQDPDKWITMLLKKNIITQSEADSLLAANMHLPPTSTTKENIEKPNKGKLWGLVYADAIYKFHADSARRGNLQYSGQPKDSSGYDFRRIFLGYNYNMSQRFSTEFILSNETETDVLQSGNRAVFIKAANLRWKSFIPLADLVVGLAATPTLTFVGDREGAVWTYRSVERSISDQRKLGSSSDAGVLLQGRFNKAGSLGYNIMLANGSGTKPESDKFKKGYAEVYGWFWSKHILVDLYGDYERNRLNPYQQSKATFKGTVAVQTERLSLGAECVTQVQQNNTIYTEPKPDAPTTIGTKKDTVQAVAFGLSMFAIGTVIKEKLHLFVRYDYYNPDLKFSNHNFYGNGYTGNTVQSYFTAGVDYIPENNIHVIPNVWYDGFWAASDGYNKVHSASCLQKDYDLVYRITISYVFNR